MDLKDVLIKPQSSSISSRGDVQLDYLPIMAANMGSTGTKEMADVLRNRKAFTALSKGVEHVTSSPFVYQFPL